MTTVARQFLSGSTNGRGILVAAVATPGTLLHTAHATDKDEVWLWGMNTSGAALKVTVEAGGVTSPDDLVEYTIPAEDGLHLLIPGLIYSGAVAIRAFAASANVIAVHGFVNRITP